MKERRVWKFLSSPRSSSSGLRLILRMGIIAFAAILLGTAFQHVHSRGMPLRLLALPLYGTSAEEAWKPMAADSAFALLLKDSAVFIDIRKKSDFVLDHIPGARSVPFTAFFRDPGLLTGFDPQATYILVDFDAESRLPRLMIQVLRKRGFLNVFFLRNGYAEWLDTGFPREAGGSS